MEFTYWGWKVTYHQGCGRALIEELDGKDTEILYEAYKNKSIHILKSDNANEKTLGVISKLEKAGVIYKSIENIYPSKTVNFSIKWIGNPNQKILNLVEKFVKDSEQLTFLTDTKLLDLLVIIRTSVKLAETMEDYKKIRCPHLFVDIAYDHTLSLGPLVFPGETSCLGCFIGRITRNWGDAEPPHNCLMLVIARNW